MNRIQKLTALLEISKALGREVLLDDLLLLILDKTTEVMDAERSSLYLYDSKKNELWTKIAQGLISQEIRLPLGGGIAGDVAKTRKPANIPDAYEDPRFNPEFDKKHNFHTKSVLCLPLFGTEDQLVGVIEIINKKSGGAFNQSDEEFLEAFGGHVAIALQRAQLVESYVENQRMEEALKLAHEIQMSFLPKTFPPASDKTRNLDIYATIQPAKEVGGDLYDFFFIEEDYLCCAIGDVSGKGVPAALFMAVTATLLKAITAKGKSPAQILSTINNSLCYNNDANMFVTFFLGILKLSNGELVYSNGGHNYPYIVHPDRTFDILKTTPVGIPLGIMESMKFTNVSTQLKKGDILLLYTDGVNEAMDVKGHQYSYESLELVLKSRQFASSKDIIDAILKNVKEFVGDASQSDDIALLTIRYL